MRVLKYAAMACVALGVAGCGETRTVYVPTPSYSIYSTGNTCSVWLADWRVRAVRTLAFVNQNKRAIVSSNYAYGVAMTTMTSLSNEYDRMKAICS